jgi:signal transduction histidine kinase
MKLSFRSRILLTLLPLLALLGIIGGVGAVLLSHLGGRIDAILRENYDSVRYMQELREALEEMNGTIRLANAGEEDKELLTQYRAAWTILDDQIKKELKNITIEGEQEAADKLRDLGNDYHKMGEEFFRLPPKSPSRHALYSRKGGLKETYDEIKKVSHRILDMNQRTMEDAEARARRTADNSLLGFTLGLVAVGMAAVWLAWNTVRATLRPVQLVTQSALAIGAGNLDQVVPVPAPNELGQLAEAFNVMARQLREFRQSNSARLLRAQQTSQATIDSFPDPVVVVDASGRVEMANPAAQRLLGVHSRDGGAPMVWQPPGDLVTLLQEAIREQRAYLPDGFHRAIRLASPGREQFFLPRILPIATPSGVTLGAAVLLQDVTRFRLLDQVKSDLVATVSHELKTPLTSIRLALHLLLEETVGPLTPKQTELLVDARDNGERLLRMVNNLLDLTRLEKGKSPLELHSEDPKALVRSAVDAIRPRANDKGVALETELPEELPQVSADAQQIAHVLGNLLDNALTYTPAGGRITVSAATDNGVVTLAVADTGIGIAPEYLPHVFNKFFRIPGHSAESGSGLGLAIVQEVVTAHGGSVSCESQPGEGSVFRVMLPVSKP